MQTSAPVICIGNNTADLARIKKMMLALNLTGEVLLFHCPKAALDYLTDSSLSPLFILCETRMKGMSGFELRKLLLWTDTPAREVPFIFLSGTRSVEELQLARSLQVRAFFVKTSRIRDLMPALQVLQLELSGKWPASLPLI
jgi:CheY-like chemotaxis protein